MYGPEGGGGSEPFRNAMIAEMEYAGLRRNDFLENTVPGMIWREEPRAVLVKPEEMGDVRIAPDEMHEGRVMATLSFALPRGSYATMLLKRLFAPPFYARTEGPDGERSPRRGYVPRERLPPAPWQQRDDEDQSE